MNNQKIRTIYSVTLVILDALLLMAAFVLAYELRVRIPWPDALANQVPITAYFGLLALQVVCNVGALFAYRLYYIPRAVSRVDQLYFIVTAVSLGTLLAIAFSTLIFKDNNAILDYPRAMMFYAWMLSIILVLLGRITHTMIRYRLLRRGWGRDHVLLVGTGDMARIILQRILWSSQLGYDIIGVVDETDKAEFLGLPVLGTPEDIPELIEAYHIDEIIIAIPEKGHRETVRIMSYCERGRVSIKIFPDVFQFVTNKAGIEDLGGLPLLSVRDYALRGYMLIFKRAIDLLGAALGLIFLSPLMLLVAIAIKLESPGPAFFVQERMGLDGKPFLMVKFRSMRRDAEAHGPGWTKDNDPRQTKLGRFLRSLEVDELPNLINVLLGEMSLVGPRPEQRHYVEEFRKIIPRYMDRHREKGGMTGWAQINGLRGDTSILERTKYDLWYSENWSIWLDLKIIIRTIWQIFERKNVERPSVGPALADTAELSEASDENGTAPAPETAVLPQPMIKDS